MTTAQNGKLSVHSPYLGQSLLSPRFLVRELATKSLYYKYNGVNIVVALDRMERETFQV